MKQQLLHRDVVLELGLLLGPLGEVGLDLGVEGQEPWAGFKSASSGTQAIWMISW